MIFKQIQVGPMQNFSYIIADSDTKEALVVDTGWDVDLIMNIIKEEDLKINKIILTHRHFDLVQKINEIALKTNAEVYFHADDEDEIRRVIGNNPVKVTIIDGKSNIDVGKIEIKVIHTPGHTQGSICLLFDKKLITADTLFVGAIGRTDLPGGNAPLLFESLQKLKKLDDEIEIYPGHDYGDSPFSTIGNEKKHNPYFKAKTKEEFLQILGF